MPERIVKPSIGLLTVDEAAHRLGVSSKTVWRFLSQGVLKRWSHWSRTAVSESEIEKLRRQRAAR